MRVCTDLQQFGTDEADGINVLVRRAQSLRIRAWRPLRPVEHRPGKHLYRADIKRRMAVRPSAQRYSRAHTLIKISTAPPMTQEIMRMIMRARAL